MYRIVTKSFNTNHLVRLTARFGGFANFPAMFDEIYWPVTHIALADVCSFTIRHNGFSPITKINLIAMCSSYMDFVVWDNEMNNHPNSSAFKELPPNA